MDLETIEIALVRDLAWGILLEALHRELDLAQSFCLGLGIPRLQRVSFVVLRGRGKADCVAEQIDQWFKHLASWEQTLEEMAAASTDQNFTEELGAIEQCRPSQLT